MRLTCDLCLLTFHENVVLETTLTHRPERLVRVCVDCIKDLHEKMEEEGW